jgi:hypothetical protein
MPFSEIGSIANDPLAPTAFFGSSDMFRELSDDAIDVIVRYATDDMSPIVSNVFRHAGGAIARIPTDANAVGSRDASLHSLMGSIVPTREALETVKVYCQRYRAELQQYLHGGVWKNSMNAKGAR